MTLRSAIDKLSQWLNLAEHAINATSMAYDRLCAHIRYRGAIHMVKHNKVRRQALGLSQKSLAGVCGVTVAQLHNWEECLETPSPQQAIAWNGALDCAEFQLRSNPVVKLRYAYAAGGWTLEGLAASCGVSRATCGRILQGHTGVNWRAVLAVASTLGVKLT